MNQHWLMPNWDSGLTCPLLPHQHFYENGLKAILLDVDKTLIPGKELIIHNSVKEWVNIAKKSLYLHLLSNNPSKYRISNIAKQLELPFTYGAAKPRRSSILKIIKIINLSPDQISIVGDRIFTDILVGNRLGLYTILVKPIDNNGLASHNNILQKFEKSLSSLLGAK